MPVVGTGSDEYAHGAVKHAPLDLAFVQSTLTARFDEAVVRHPDRIAVSDGGVETGYGQLSRRVSALAEALTAAGLRQGEPAAVLVDQGLAAVTCVLAVLRAGGAFAPLDVLDPPPRAARLLELAGARIVVTSAARATQAREVARAAADAPVIVVAEDSEASGRPTPPVVTSPCSPASVFFTSGSTGTPKAVLDLHCNILHNALRYTNLLQLSAADRLSLVQRPSFSGTASSLFGALLNGATVCTYALTADNLDGLAAWVARERITVFHSVPTVFRALTDSAERFPHVRVVRLEGDRATWEDVARFRRAFAADALLANGLGTTETGLACQFRVGRDMPLEEGVLPVGYPAPGVEIALLGEDGSPVADGEVGEIAVGSRYLAARYLGAAKLTAERFLELGDGHRVYLTGDLGRTGPFGRLEYLGRLDGTCKVGGVRVEPAEVEAALLALDGVTDAAVTVEGSPRGQGRLVARVVTRAEGPDERRIRRALRRALPPFMIPSRIVVVPDLAVDTNWKVSRSLSNAPRTRLEQELCDIWAAVLETEVGVDDTFADLGGDSLAAAQVTAAIGQRLGVEVPFSLLARTPTVARLAAALEAPVSHDGVSLTVLSDRGDGIPLVLLPGHWGHAIMYAGLAAAIDPRHPVWAIEITASADDLSVRALAARIAATLCRAAPDEPLAIGGFCYGAVLTLEVARLLRARGSEVHPVLLGLEPVDVPGLVSADALARWRRDVGPHRWSITRVRHHLRHARMAGERSAAHYLATVTGRAARHGIGVLRGRRGPTALQLGAAGFDPAPLDGPATVVLGSGTAARYTDDPASAWAPLADDVDVVLVPGISNDTVLLQGEVGRLATVLSALLSAAGAQTEPYSASTMRTNSFVSS